MHFPAGHWKHADIYTTTAKLFEDMSIRWACRLHICQQPHSDLSIGGNSTERINQ